MVGGAVLGAALGPLGGVVYGTVLGSLLLPTPWHFMSNFHNMETANTIGADKYFHCLANCQSSADGTLGRGEAYLMSEAREYTDEYLKGDSRLVCDRIAPPTRSVGAFRPAVRAPRSVAPFDRPVFLRNTSRCARFG